MRRTRHFIRATAAVVAVLTIGACAADTTTERAVNPAPSAPPPTTIPPTTVAPTTVAPETTPPTAPPTVATEPPTTVAVTAPVASPASLILRPGGLGDFPFGAPADPTIAQISAILGPPTTDSGWVAAFGSPFGVCPGDEVRGVTWGGLLMLFADETLIVSGQRHLFHYVYGPEAKPAGLVTDSGIALGSTVAAIRAAHPDVAVFEDELLGSAAFALGTAGLGGTLSDTSDAGIVTTITGGQGCGE